MIKKEVIGTHEGKEIYQYTLDNSNGLSAEILNYGGIIKSLTFCGIDMVFGMDSFDDYLNNGDYFGVIVGRNSNRIVGAKFELGDKTYTIPDNDNGNNLHSGPDGFDKKIWDCSICDDVEPSLILSYTSPDGEQGFPSEVKVKVTYTLTADNSLKIHYEGTSDSDTLLNMTNHSYFNLNGHDSGSIHNHTLWLRSSFYTPNAKTNAPYGEVLSVSNTPFDFRKAHKLTEALNSTHAQILLCSGLDHNLVLDGFGYRLAAKLVGDKSGVSMEMYTDAPGVQLYSGNFVNKEKLAYKDGVIYSSQCSLCMETQAFPNFTQNSHFPSGILKKGEKYDTTTTYKFYK